MSDTTITYGDWEEVDNWTTLGGDTYQLVKRSVTTTTTSYVLGFDSSPEPPVLTPTGFEEVETVVVTTEYRVFQELEDPDGRSYWSDMGATEDYFSVLAQAVEAGSFSS